MIERISLKGKIALVTGGGGGIGRATVIALAGAGASVAIVDLYGERAQESAKEVEALGVEALAIEANAAEESDIERMFNETIRKLGRIDILVNNGASAGKGLGGPKPFLEMVAADWDASQKGVIRSYFLASLRAAKEMTKQGGGGKIINIGSIGADIALERQTSYCSGKAGIQGLTRSLAMELGPHRINVNVVNPGFIDTAASRRILTDHQRQARINRIPLGRYGQPEDIANAVLFFASPLSDWISGQALTVDGGFRSSFMIPPTG